jgi:hypothetical protein
MRKIVNNFTRLFFRKETLKLETEIDAMITKACELARRAGGPFTTGEVGEAAMEVYLKSTMSDNARKIYRTIGNRTLKTEGSLHPAMHEQLLSHLHVMRDRDTNLMTNSLAQYTDDFLRDLLNDIEVELIGFAGYVAERLATE